MKRVVIRLTPEAEEVYQHLKIKAPDSKQEETFLNAFLQKVELLKRNFRYGQPIAKNLIPLDYRTKYGITNLFRAELPLLENALHGHGWKFR